MQAPHTCSVLVLCAHCCDHTLQDKGQPTTCLKWYLWKAHQENWWSFFFFFTKYPLSEWSRMSWDLLKPRLLPEPALAWLEGAPVVEASTEPVPQGCWRLRKASLPVAQLWFSMEGCMHTEAPWSRGYIAVILPLIPLCHLPAGDLKFLPFASFTMA